MWMLRSVLVSYRISDKNMDSELISCPYGRDEPANSQGVAYIEPVGYDPIASCVLQCLQNAGMSIEDLARRSGVNATSISRWLAGRRGIRYESLVAILNILKIVVLSRPEPAQAPRPHQAKGRP